MRTASIPVSAVALLLAVSGAGAYQEQDRKAAGNKPAKGTKEQPKNVKEQPKPLTSEQEAEALRFVREHHPQLAELLSQLKSSNTAQYQQALRDLHRAATTLGDTRKVDPRKYELDLKAWQVNSHIQVLAAKYMMAPSPEVESELKARLQEQIDIKLQQQSVERDRVASRLEKLDAAIAKARESRQQDADRAFEKLTRSTSKPGRKKGGPNSASSATPKKNPAEKSGTQSP